MLKLNVLLSAANSAFTQTHSFTVNIIKKHAPYKSIHVYIFHPHFTAAQIQLEREETTTKNEKLIFDKCESSLHKLEKDILVFFFAAGMWRKI